MKFQELLVTGAHMLYTSGPRQGWTYSLCVRAAPVDPSADEFKKHESLLSQEMVKVIWPKRKNKNACFNYIFCPPSAPGGTGLSSHRVLFRMPAQVTLSRKAKGRAKWRKMSKTNSKKYAGTIPVSKMKPTGGHKWEKSLHQRNR